MPFGKRLLRKRARKAPAWRSARRHRAPRPECAAGASSPPTTDPAAARDWLRWAPPGRFGTPLPCLFHSKTQFFSAPGLTQVPPASWFACSSAAISTLPAFITSNTHAPKTPCRTPIFLDFEAARRGDGPREPPVLRADHARVRAPIFNMNPAHVERLFRASWPNRCRQASERGFRMGRMQPHGIAGSQAHRGPDFKHQPRLCFSACSGPARHKWHSQHREGPRQAQKALPGRFTPDC